MRSLSFLHKDVLSCRPSVILTSEDDPFVDIRDYKSAKYFRLCHLHIEKHGRHMGYLSKGGTLPNTNRWLDYALEHYINSLKF